MANTSPKAERPASTKDAANGAAPVGSFRFGSVSAAVFTNRVTTQGGKTLDVFNVSLRRSYRNAGGEWEHTHTLRTADLLPAAYALLKCYDFIAEANGSDDEERQ
jgi:hypothetical protein